MTKRGCVSSIDALVAAGEDMNLRGIRTGSSALDLAADQGHLDVLKTLGRHVQATPRVRSAVRSGREKQGGCDLRARPGRR